MTGGLWMKKECTTTNCNTLRNTLHYNNTIQYNNNDTVVFSIRVPRYVRDYFKENGLSFSKILLDFYYHQRENQIRKLQEEIQELENCVTNKRIKVTQLMSQVTQNNDICNTLLDTFKQQGRDINNPTQ